jgi:hypothetical protein
MPLDGSSFSYQTTFTVIDEIGTAYGYDERLCYNFGFCFYM